MSKEHKHYELRRARKTRPGPLSSVVLTTNEHGERGYCYVSFGDTLIQAVGMALPRGVSLHDPAYLEVVYEPNKKTWNVTARYLSDDSGKVLWKTDEIPSWLTFNTRRQNANDQAEEPSPRKRYSDALLPRIRLDEPQDCSAA